jgi:shikimate dehydrogenase
MHEAAARSIGLEAFYHLIDVRAASSAELRRMIEGVRHLGFAGVNVTYPYKEAVVPFLDELAPEAKRIGAVNTIVIAKGRLVGHNTDASGFRRVIQPFLTEGDHRPVALIGAGGFGKAAGFALADGLISGIRIFDTDRAKAEGLARALEGRIDVTLSDTLDAAVSGVSGIVNGTPVGMLPDCGSPVPARLLRAGLWVADAVYSPLWTPLLTAARAAGARVMTGRDLAIAQAVDAFTLFTGRAPQASVMAEAFDTVISARNMAASARNDAP